MHKKGGGKKKGMECIIWRVGDHVLENNRRKFTSFVQHITMSTAWPKYSKKKLTTEPNTQII